MGLSERSPKPPDQGRYVTEEELVELGLRYAELDQAAKTAPYARGHRKYVGPSFDDIEAQRLALMREREAARRAEFERSVIPKSGSGA